MPKYKVVIEGAGKEYVTLHLDCDGMNSDPFWVRFLREHRITKVDVGQQPAAEAYLVAQIPRERVIAIEKED